jgi:hypothetical protein
MWGYNNHTYWISYLDVTCRSQDNIELREGQGESQREGRGQGQGQGQGQGVGARPWNGVPYSHIIALEMRPWA